jgi:hypothetical protein
MLEKMLKGMEVPCLEITKYVHGEYINPGKGEITDHKGS